MPSIFSRLRPKNPKVFSKTADIVKKKFGKKTRQDEIVVAPPVALNDPDQRSFNANVTNNGQTLPAVHENSFEEKQDDSRYEPSNIIPSAADGTYATLIEHEVPEQKEFDDDDDDEAEQSELDILDHKQLDEENSLMNSRAASPIPVLEQLEPSFAVGVVAAMDDEDIQKSSTTAIEDNKQTDGEVSSKQQEEKPMSTNPISERSTIVVGSTVIEQLEVNSLVEEEQATQGFTPVFSAATAQNVKALRAKFENSNTKPSPLRVVLQKGKYSKHFLEAKASVTAKPSAPAKVELEPNPAQDQLPVVVLVHESKESDDFLPQEDQPTIEEPSPIETPSNEVTVEASSPEVVEKEAKSDEPFVPVPIESCTVKPQVEITQKTLAIIEGEEAALNEEMLKIASKPYKDQAVWFLNAFWNSHFKENPTNCERVWAFTHKFTELDPAGSIGCELDELRAHRVLEILDDALTFTEMRTKFHVRARHVSLSELLIFVFKVDWIELVTAPQGAEGVAEQMAQAEALMEKSSAAVTQSRAAAKIATDDERQATEKAQLALESKKQAIAKEQEATEREKKSADAEIEAIQKAEQAALAAKDAADRAEVARVAEEETIKRAETSLKAEDEAKRGEEQATAAELKAVENEKLAREAESEAFRREESARESEKNSLEAERILIEGQARVEAALNKVKEEEIAFAKHLEELKQTSEDESLGIVARRKANHEREVLLAKDPDPLTRARIAEEAVVRKHEKLIRSATQAREKAVKARTDSERSRELAVKSRAESENARAEAAIRRSACETKLQAAAEARKLSEEAREHATLKLAEAKESQEASDNALKIAQSAKESATAALQQTIEARKEAVDFRVCSENDEAMALEAKKLAEESRERAEKAVVEALAAFDRAQSFVERVRKQASSGQGGWWWASREIQESKRFLPQKALKRLE